MNITNTSPKISMYQIASTVFAMPYTSGSKRAARALVFGEDLQSSTAFNRRCENENIFGICSSRFYGVGWGSYCGNYIIAFKKGVVEMMNDWRKPSTYIVAACVLMGTYWFFFDFLDHIIR